VSRRVVEIRLVKLVALSFARGWQRLAEAQRLQDLQAARRYSAIPEALTTVLSAARHDNVTMESRSFPYCL
jgi:hypothetical protein